MYEQPHELFLLGLFGAAAAEFLKFYQRRRLMTEAKFRSMMKSPLHWTLVMGMLIASGFIAWAFADGSPRTAWEAVFYGIGATALIRLPISTVEAAKQKHLGSSYFSARDMFL